MGNDNSLCDNKCSRDAKEEQRQTLDVCSEYMHSFAFRTVLLDEHEFSVLLDKRTNVGSDMYES